MIIFKRIEDRKPLFPFSDNECQSDGSSEVAGFDLKDESAEEEADLLKDVLNDIDDTMVDTTAFANGFTGEVTIVAKTYFGSNM